MNYDFDIPVDRCNTYSLKWDRPDLFHKGDKPCKICSETIPMMIADMDFRCSPAIIEALHRTVDNGIYGYSSWESEPKYARAIINWYKNRYNTVFEEKDIVFASGSLDAVNQSIRAFSEPGDGIILCRPVYGNFNSCINTVCHRKIVGCNLINDGNGYYTMDWEDFEEKCSVASNKVFILCSPANPVGRVWTFEELKRIDEICKKHSIVLVSDEIHSDILRKGIKHHTIYSVAKDDSNIVMITATNKTFNLAGLHCANVIITNDELRKKFTKDFAWAHPSPFAIASLIAAYTQSDDWLEALNDYIDGNLRFAVDFIHKNMPKVKVWYPEGSYMLWLDFRAYGLSDDEVHERIYLGASVMLQDGLVHDPENGECFQRVCAGCARSVLEKALIRMAKQFACSE